MGCSWVRRRPSRTKVLPVEIRVKLMGVLKDKTPPNGKLELPNGATIKDAIEALAIPIQSIQVCTVNGSVERDRARSLAADDELTVLAPVGGG